MAEAVHEVDGMLVLDCIASGATWVDMKALGVDVLISAPQKGWTGSPCCGLVMLSANASERLRNTTSTSFACDLRKWREIMEVYEKGGHAYHATMPTDGLKAFASVMKETEDYGFDSIRLQQEKLGAKVRELLASRGIKSLAAEGFQAPSVVVSYTDDVAIHSGKKFTDVGLQIALVHTFYNVTASLFFLAFLNPFERVVRRLTPDRAPAKVGYGKRRLSKALIPFSPRGALILSSKLRASNCSLSALVKPPSLPSRPRPCLSVESKSSSSSANSGS